MRTSTLTLEGARVVGGAVVVEIDVVTVVGVLGVVTRTVVGTEVEVRWVAAVVGTLPVRASTKTPTTTATTTTMAALNGCRGRGRPPGGNRSPEPPPDGPRALNGAAGR